jgi:hypothetical protein
MSQQIITFPECSGIRCLMMPYIQGDPESVPEQYRAGYEDILRTTFIKKGDIGFLTIDESEVTQGVPHRGNRAKFGRALHTEAGLLPNKIYAWGGAWGGLHNVELSKDVKVLLANNIDESCALWDATHENTSADGDIGDFAEQYPYEDATVMKAGEVHQIGILTPHESLAVKKDGKRQFLRIISAGVTGREPHFTENPLVSHVPLKH